MTTEIRSVPRLQYSRAVATPSPSAPTLMAATAPTPSSGQIDTVTAVVRDWTLNEQTGKITVNFSRGRIGTIVKEETLRLPTNK